MEPLPSTCPPTLRNCDGVPILPNGQLCNTHDYTIAGIVYSLCLADQNGQESQIAAIMTADPGFVTPEGVALGDTLDQIARKTSGRVEVVTDPVWFALEYCRLPSGWGAALESHISWITITGEVVPPTRSAPRVSHFFKLTPNSALKRTRPLPGSQ